MNSRRIAFTLIEMLTVIAITAVLMTIIVLPIFQSFNLTRAAEAFSDAQDQARRLTEKVSREIGTAVSVRGTGGTVSSILNGTLTSLPTHSLVVQVPGKDGSTVDVVLPWVKLDVVPPGQEGIFAAGGFVDPVTGKVDPTLKDFKGKPRTPVVPGGTLIRYSVGLRDPFSFYNEPYSGLLMTRTGGRDNLIVLYRSVAVPYLPGHVVNTALFANSNGTAVLDDPRFLVPDRDSSGNVIQNTHNLRIYHWLGLQPTWEASVDESDSVEHAAGNVAHTVVQTQVSRYDMIMPQYDKGSRAVLYDGNIPRLTPMIQFRPTVVSNDPAAGQEALRPGEETDNATAIGPDVYKTQYGLWNNAVIRTYPAGFLSTSSTADQYLVGYVPATGNAPGFSIFAYDPASGGTEFTAGSEVFDTFSYDNAVSMLGGTSRVYPFTFGALQANSRSGWLGDPNLHKIFTPYHLLPGTGKIMTSFDISEVGTANATFPNDPNQDPNRPNLPTLYTSNVPMSPLNDPGTGAAYSGANYDVNSAFNRAWNEHTYLQPNIQRFIDLRVTPNEDGTLSPLYPLTSPNQVTDFMLTQPDGSMLNRCRLVPGTETVVGPDQAPGAHYGHPIRYSRVTGAPGPNQYRINYVDLPEPSLPASGQPNSSVVSAASYQAALGLNSNDVSGFNVDTYDPTNFVSATLQPRYKAGYIQLNSDPNLPIPQGYVFNGNLVRVPFKVDYRFQFTGVLPTGSVSAGAGRSDSFAVDYDTRQLMQVLLTIRNYPQSNLPNPQTVTLKATATIKNVIR